MAGKRTPQSIAGVRAQQGLGVLPAILAMATVLALGVSAASRVWAGDEDRKPPSGSDRGRPEEPEPPHQKVHRFEIGQGPRSYLLFEPDQPRPEQAPVVVFLHGWFAVNPGFYGAWIDHLVRHGRIVIFPRYQNDVGTMPQDFLPNAMAAVHDAMGVLHVGVGHVRPDPAQFALIGHSAGATVAAQIAALTADPHTDLPKPKALIAIMPGEVIPMRQPTLDKIPETTLLIVAVGEEDLVVGDHRGRQIFTEATAIPPSRRRFVFFRSDRHGHPALIADHAAPTGSHPRLDNGEGLFRSLQLSLSDVNALDRAGFWRIADVALDAGFAGKTLDEVTRDEERFRHLGYWSDGRRVNPPIISAELDGIPRVIPANGLKIFPWPSSAKPKVALAPKASE
jgi:pimeloyl-ACP methyl ester carboxylesterase